MLNLGVFLALALTDVLAILNKNSFEKLVIQLIIKPYLVKPSDFSYIEPGPPSSSTHGDVMAPAWSEDDQEVRDLMKALTSSAEDAILFLEAAAEGFAMICFPDQEESEIQEPKPVPVHATSA